MLESQRQHIRSIRTVSSEKNVLLQNWLVEIKNQRGVKKTHVLNMYVFLFGKLIFFLKIQTEMTKSKSGNKQN